MGGTVTLFKVFVGLGLLMLMVGLMFPGQDAAWINLQNTMADGVNFPTFDNPFAPNQVSVIGVPVDNANSSGGTDLSHFESVTGCSAAAYWQCVASNNGNTSYVTLNSSGELVGSLLNVNMTPLSGSILSVTVTIWCRVTPNQGTPINDNIHHVGVARPVDACANSTDFHAIRAVIPQPYPWDSGSYNSAGSGILLSTNITGKIDITYIQDDIVLDAGATAAQCGGNVFQNTGCQLSRFVDLVTKGVLFLFNGVVFVIVSFIALVVFIISVLVALLTAVLGIAAVMFNLGAPAPIQYVLDVLFVGLIVWILYEVVIKTMRGMVGPG